MAASERRQLQQQLKQPDPFFEAILEAREYFEANRSMVLGVAGGVVALVVAIVGGASWYVSQGQRAASDFASAVSSLQADSTAAAATDLDKIRSLSNAGPYKPLAALYRGDLAAAAGRNEEAIVAYDEFLADAPTDYLRQIGLMGKAAALEQTGRAAEMASTLDQAAEIDGPYRKFALGDRARLAEASGDKAAATTNLEKLLEIEGSGPGAADVEKRLQALK